MSDRQLVDPSLLPFEEKKFAYEALRKEVEYRRDKAWNLFSWASTLLLGVIGGLMAIARKPEDALPWWPHRTLLIVALLILTIYSVLWLDRNSDIRDKALAKMESIEATFGIKPEYIKNALLSYLLTVLLLGLAAIVAVIFIPCVCCPCR